MRAFIALPLAPGVREALVRAGSQLRAQAWADPVRWAPAENLHLTLRFLGEVSEASIPGLRAALGTRLTALDCFGCEIVGLTLLPSASQARVVAARVSSEPRLSELAAAVESAAVAAGFDPEPRHFRAHITLGRFRRSGHPEDERTRAPNAAKGASMRASRNEAMRQGMQMEPPAPRIEVHQVALYRSLLGQRGARYRELARVALAGPPGPRDGAGAARS